MLRSLHHCLHIYSDRRQYSWPPQHSWLHDWVAQASDTRLRVAKLEKKNLGELSYAKMYRKRLRNGFT